MTEGQIGILPIVVIVSTIGFLPFAVVTMTGFLKISVVLFLIRNALGVQQSPPNLLLYGIALILTVYVTAPVVAAVASDFEKHNVDIQTVEGLQSAAAIARPTIQAYLSKYADEKERTFFIGATEKLWPPEQRVVLKNDDLIVLVPAFVSSELTRAFQIGFLLYLPFLVVDLIVSNVLMAMGMAMVSPTLISIPLKIFLFVAVEGWSRLMHGLILSYA